MPQTSTAAVDQHRRRQAVRPQRDAERRRPAADDVLQRVAGAPDGGGDRNRDGEPERHQHNGDALRMPPAEQQRQQHARDRQHDRQNEQKSRLAVRRHQRRASSDRASEPRLAPPVS